MVRKISYRKDFIDYVLYNYEFEDRIAVWILNFLKSHPVVSKNISFTYDETIERKLRIAATGTDRPTLLFEKGDTVTIDGEVIFHEINMNQDEILYLEFAFPKQDTRYQNVKEIENNLDAELQAISKDAILRQIDQALDNQDQALFNKLTKMLNQST
ncbi:YpiB family protein [Salinicoccus sp. HZC-1]|uniref:YpiB family protein n=1 Tax=Salinicoccus sp. HZC-1 TaxID=3385497 RepID=UPI00398A9B4D